MTDQSSRHEALVDEVAQMIWDNNDSPAENARAVLALIAERMKEPSPTMVANGSGYCDLSFSPGIIETKAQYNAEIEGVWKTMLSRSALTPGDGE